MAHKLMANKAYTQVGGCFNDEWTILKQIVFNEYKGLEVFTHGPDQHGFCQIFTSVKMSKTDMYAFIMFIRGLSFGLRARTK